jgi:hypothetical protein
MVRTFVFVWLLVAAAVWGQDSPWKTDLDAALKESSTTGKPLLVVVTGSDWSAPSMRMEVEVWSRTGFLKAATDKYVLLRLDFPHQTTPSERSRGQNLRWTDQYPFQAFPTVYLLDASGFLFGQRTGYIPGGIPGFLALLTTFEAQKAPLQGLVHAVQKTAPGVERAKAEDALFRQAEAWNLTSQYGDLPLRIVQDDKEGSAGLKPRYQVYQAYSRLLGTWADLPDFHQAIDDLDKLSARAQPWPDLQQKILFTQGMIWLNALRDEFKARDAFRKVKALGADTQAGQRAAELLDQLP